VHYHFGSLDGVVAALADQVGRAWLATLAEVVETHAGFIDRWRALQAAERRDIDSGQARLRMELGVAALADSARRERWAVYLDARRALLAGLVSDMLAEYRLSAGLAVPATALVSALGQGLAGEQLAGLTAGHAELERWMEGWLLALGDPSEPGPTPGVRPG
jgi:AcrR family transcriptional regulator